MHRQTPWLVLLTLLLAGPACAGTAQADTTGKQVPPPVANPLKSLPPEEARQVLQWAADWVRQVLPESYHNDKQWGKKTRVYAGVKFDLDEGQLKTKRRWKELGHGRWLRYDVHLRDPTDPQRLNIQITQAEQGQDQRIHFAAQVDTVLDVELHQERWNLGTRLFSISVQAEVTLRMLVAGDVGFELDLTRIPPDILADPQITSTELSLVDLKVKRISKIGGEVAESIGDLVKRIIRQEYLPGQQQAITQKLNSQIDRRRDRLRLGASQWLSSSAMRSLTPTASAMPIAEADSGATARNNKDDHQ